MVGLRQWFPAPLIFSFPLFLDNDILKDYIISRKFNRLSFAHLAFKKVWGQIIPALSRNDVCF